MSVSRDIRKASQFRNKPLTVAEADRRYGGAGAADWSAITGKPSLFPPSAHVHDQSEVTGLSAALAVKAPLSSPGLSGVPTAPTAAGGTNTTQIATTAFVQAAVIALINAAPGALDTLDELAAALGDDANFAATITAALAGKAATSHTHTALGISDSTAAGRGMLMAADAAAQTALLNVFTSALKGLVPASGGGTTNFLRADGAWVAPGGGGGASPLLGWFI